MAGSAFQREFAQKERVFQQLVPDLRRGGQHADGDGQVVGRAFLAQIGRGQVDRDALDREREAAVLDGRVDAIPALAHGRIRQADEGKIGLSSDDVDFDRYQFRVQPNHGRTEHFREHAGDYNIQWRL